MTWKEDRKTTPEAEAAREEQRQGLIQRLQSGTRTIKEGHRVKDLNPSGEAKVLPLRPGEIVNRIGELWNLGGEVADSSLPEHVRTVVERRRKWEWR